MISTRQEKHPLVHLNNAASSLMDPGVNHAVRSHLDLENEIGPIEAMLASGDVLGGLYDDLSKLIVVPAERIAVGSSNTDIWQRAMAAVSLSPGDKILAAESEWGGNLSMLWSLCQRTGAKMRIIPSTPDGAIDVEAFAAMLDNKVRVVCVTWVPSVNGLINDLGGVADAMAQHDALLFVDAAQAFGQVTTDLSHSRVDVMTVAARKYMRAPRGTGFGAFSQRFLEHETPILVDQFSCPWNAETPDLLPNAKRFEFGEAPYAIRVGLAEAVKIALECDWGDIQAKIQHLASYTRDALSQCKGVTIEDRASNLSGIVTFSLNGIAPVDLVANLHRHSINLSAPGKPYSPLWFNERRPLIVRVSPQFYNTTDEIDFAVSKIADEINTH